MEELLDHAWSGRLTAASVTFAKMEAISAVGLSLATIREVCRLCSGWGQRCSLDRVDDCIHGRQEGVDPGEQRADSFHHMCMLLVSQDMKHASPATFHTELFYPSTSLPRAERAR